MRGGFTPEYSSLAEPNSTGFETGSSSFVDGPNWVKFLIENTCPICGQMPPRDYNPYWTKCECKKSKYGSVAE